MPPAPELHAVTSYLPWLLMTLIVEAAVVLAFPGGRRSQVLASVAINLVTHPIATLAYVEGAPLELIEIGVWLAECAGYLILLGGGWRRSVMLATFANGATVLVATTWS